MIDAGSDIYIIIKINTNLQIFLLEVIYSIIVCTRVDRLLLLFLLMIQNNNNNNKYIYINII